MSINLLQFSNYRGSCIMLVGKLLNFMQIIKLKFPILSMHVCTSINQQLLYIC